MNVKKIVYIVLGFVLIVVGVYWAVNYLVNSTAKETNTNSYTVDESNKLKQQEDNAHNLDGMSSPEKTDSQPVNQDTVKAETIETTDSQAPQIDTGEETKTQETDVQSLVKEKAPISEQQKREKLNVIRDELKKIALGDPKSVDFNKLDALLLELQSMGDENGVVGGVNIPQLRKIIEQSNKIIQTSQNQGLLPGEDKNQKLKDEVQTLQDLQQGIIIKNE